LIGKEVWGICATTWGELQKRHDSKEVEKRGGEIKPSCGLKKVEGRRESGWNEGVTHVNGGD